MSTETQPSEHAIETAYIFYVDLAGRMMPGDTVERGEKAVVNLAQHIQTHAIAPAVAERDRRIAELVETLIEYLNYSSIDGAPERRNLRAKLIVLLAKHGGAHE